jgi:hypothetical protein
MTTSVWMALWVIDVFAATSVAMKRTARRISIPKAI